MSDKHKVRLPVVFLNKKCAELNGLTDYEYIGQCGNTECPFYYLEGCPFFYPRKTSITVTVKTEGDTLL